MIGTQRIRTGIFGGSFNPVHNGHLDLARHLLSVSLLDEVWFVVSPQNPLKLDSKLLDDETRLHMVRLAVENDPQIQASDFEFHMPRPSYMWHTLRSMSMRWPERKFFLIIGADNWLCFDRWFAHDEILANFDIIIYPRSGSPIDETSLPANVHLVDLPLNDISSTLVRRNVSLGRPIDDLVPSEVAFYIRRYGLYR